MNFYLYGSDSLRALRRVRSEKTLVLRPVSCLEYPRKPLRPQVRDVCAALGLEEPLDLTFFSREERSKSELVRTHALLCGPPPEAYLEVLGLGTQERVFVEAPGLCLVRMAALLKGRVRQGSLSQPAAIIRLVALGMELCGLYSRDPELPLEADCTYADVTPVCSPEQVADLLESLRRVHGVELARQASGYLRSGSGSPLETLLSLAIRLPESLGGAGLPAPLENDELVWDPGMQALLRHGSMHPDFWWPDFRLAVEVNGRTHLEPASQNEDHFRAQDYQLAGVSMIPFTYVDLCSVEALTRSLNIIAAKLGRPVRSTLPAELREARGVLLSQLRPPRQS